MFFLVFYNSFGCSGCFCERLTLTALLVGGDCSNPLLPFQLLALSQATTTTTTTDTTTTTTSTTTTTTTCTTTTNNNNDSVAGFYSNYYY